MRVLRRSAKTVDRWLDGLSNWQYVAVAASFGILVFVVGDGVIALTGPLKLRYAITSGLLDIVVIVGLSAARRWK